MKQVKRFLVLLMVLCLFGGTISFVHADPTNYDVIFADVRQIDSALLLESFMYDTDNFLEALAFQDMETKNYVFHTIISILPDVSDFFVLRDKVEDRMLDEQRTKSETALLEALDYNLTYLICHLYTPANTELESLFQQAVEAGEPDLDLSRNLSYALIHDTVMFVRMLSAQSTQTQSVIFANLSLQTGAMGHCMIEKLQNHLFIEYDPPKFNDSQFETLEKCLQVLEENVLPPITFSDPDPQELEQWLAGKETDAPVVLEPTYITIVTRPTPIPTETEEVTIPTVLEQPSPSDNEHSNPSWISAVCFVIAAFAAGVAVGGRFRFSKKAATPVPKTENIPQPAPQVFPKRIYCPAPLEPDTQKQITAALREHYQEYSIDWYTIKNPGGTCRCYGSAGGYDVIFYAGGFRLEIPEKQTVAAETFWFGTAFELLVHKDGVLTPLDTAYQQGLVNDQTISEAAHLHKNIYKEETL